MKLLSPREREENEQARSEILAVVHSLGKRSAYTELYSAITSLPQKRNEFSSALEILISALADMILAKKTDVFNPVFFTDTGEAKEAGYDIPLARLIRIYDIVIHTYRECEKNANVTLAAANMASRIKMA